ncbi:MAG: sensor histidine kinase [Parabacteroides merdae]
MLNLSICLCRNSTVFVDKEAITKIFSNLFYRNAIKYASGSIIIRLQLSPDYETFTIDFINDGTPIPAELKEKIFEPFFRVKRRRYG